jgi:hypothetical protein
MQKFSHIPYVLSTNRGYGKMLLSKKQRFLPILTQIFVSFYLEFGLQNGCRRAAYSRAAQHVAAPNPIFGLDRG